MLVRHNTTLLEHAVDLQVKRSAIPTLQAEAAAHDKIARASGFRRLATGAAVAIGAVGIGICAFLILATPTKSPMLSPNNAIGENDASNPASAQPDKTQTKVEKLTPADAIGESNPDQAAVIAEPNPVTLDYTKFANRSVTYQGIEWTLTSGHHFSDENSKSWDSAWCYTRRIVGGVDINLDLVNRAGPAAKPRAPISPPQTFASMGLNEDQARELAAKCAWLDNANYTTLDFETPPERATSSAFLVQDGWDALSNDLPNMPIGNVSFKECENSCAKDSRCEAVTYNKVHSACFLKNDAMVLIRNSNATTSARETIAGGFTYSNLVFSENTVVVGDPYSNASSIYEDCVMACALDERCAAFNFDSNRMCSLLGAAQSSSPFRGVSSGRKADFN